MSLLANGRGISLDEGLVLAAVCVAPERAGLVRKAERIRNRATPRYVLERRFSGMFDLLPRREDSPSGPVQ
jgi:hypothetical protein